MMKDDDFKLFEGFWFMTDEQTNELMNERTNKRTDICECRVAFAIEKKCFS